MPKLEAGKDSAGVGKAEIGIPTGADLGVYQATLCADARNEVGEDKEGNNCEDAGKFYVVRKQWAGSFGGLATPFSLSGITESWNAADARFELDPNAVSNDGLFVYKLKQATITYEDSGSFGGCTYAGSGVEGSPSGILRLQYADEKYMGQANNRSGFSYPVLVTCPGGGTYVGYPGPAVIPPFTAPVQNLPFGTTKLGGTYSGPAATWGWSLR